MRSVLKRKISGKLYFIGVMLSTLIGSLVIGFQVPKTVNAFFDWGTACMPVGILCLPPPTGPNCQFCAPGLWEFKPFIPAGGSWVQPFLCGSTPVGAPCMPTLTPGMAAMGKVLGPGLISMPCGGATAPPVPIL